MSASIVFTPVTVNRTVFKNRILLPSMVTHYAAPNGEVSDRLLRYHEARARGGVGLNMLEAACVDDTGRSYFPGVDIASDRCVRGLKRLVAAVHAAGGKIGVQLHHAGRLAMPEASGRPRSLVSFVPGLTPHDDSVALDAREIQRLTRAFVRAAERALEAGFDVIEIHGAHGYLPAQFMSPLFNRREDEYGGDFAGRMRFPLDVIRGVRAVAGPDYPLFFRCSVEEYLPGGITLPLACDIARAVAAAGIDLFHVSVGLPETNEYTGPPPCMPPAWNADRAAAVKNALAGGAAVAVAGRIADREAAEAVLTAGKADMVAMGRALIADPDLPAKMARDEDDDILPCIGCNEGCAGRLAEREAVRCALNPRTGREALYPLRPVAGNRRVIVVGGGPAGMEAALTAARRRCRVTLLEQTDRLGGLLRTAALPPHKAVLTRLASWYERRLRAEGVQVELQCRADADTLEAMRPDTLFIAVGGEAAVPRFASRAPCVPAETVLRGEWDTAGARTALVLGGGLVGCETAEFLAAQGLSVTLAELRSTLAPDMQARARKLLLKRLDDYGVVIMLDTEVLHVDGNGAVAVRNVYGADRVLPPADVTVLAAGYQPHRELCAALAARGVPFMALGDCVRPGNIMTAIHQAHAAACQL